MASQRRQNGPGGSRHARAEFLGKASKLVILAFLATYRLESSGARIARLVARALIREAIHPSAERA